MPLRGLPSLIQLLSISSVIALWNVGRTSTYRFQLIVEIDTPFGSRVGASVYEVRTRRRVSIDLQSKSSACWVYGEAVAIDLPCGDALFTLLKFGTRSEGLARMSMRALDPAYDNDFARSGRALARRKHVREEAIVATADYPLMARFRDIADASTIERVHPDDMTASFGPGYAVKKISVLLTRRRMTKGISKRLPWLKHFGKRTQRPFRAKDLPLGDFKGLFSTEL